MREKHREKLTERRSIDGYKMDRYIDLKIYIYIYIYVCVKIEKERARERERERERERWRCVREAEEGETERYKRQREVHRQTYRLKESTKKALSFIEFPNTSQLQITDAKIGNRFMRRRSILRFLVAKMFYSHFELHHDTN